MAPKSPPLQPPLPHDSQPTSNDDWLMLIALGILAFALADFSHEALGHGLATLAIGDKPVLLTTCFFTSDGRYSRWIPAAGGLMNLLVGLASLTALRFLPDRRPSLRFFFLLVAAFNLFNALGYPGYSGLTNFGDWAAVTAGLRPPWLLRALLVVLSVFGYYGVMRLLAAPLASFAVDPGTPTAAARAKRLDRLTYPPFFAAVVLACAAGALNPNGWRTMLNAGLPAAGAAFGLTQVKHLLAADRQLVPATFAGNIARSTPWLIAALFVAAIFVGVLGPGVRFR